MSKKGNLDSLVKRQNAQNRSKSQMISRSLKEVENKTSLSNLLLSQEVNNNINKSYWEELNNIERAIAKGIVKFAETIYENTLAVTASGNFTTVFKNIVNSALKDSEEFKNKLIILKTKHENKTGRITDSKDLELYYDIGNAYNNLYETFMQITFQYATEITALRSDDFENSDTKTDLETLADNVIKANVTE